MLARAADRRPSSAFRRFPPGCGRPHNAAAGPPPYHRPPTAAATAAAKTKPTLPNPSSARAATSTAPTPARPALPATASFGAEAPDRGVGNGRKAAAAAAAVAVPVRLVSAFRRYPPGCGRGVAMPKPSDSEGGAEREDGAAGKPSAVVVGNGDANARACHEDGGSEFSSNGRMTSGGDGEAGAQEEGGGKPWEVTGLMAVPFLPWAQHERRSQSQRASS